MALSNAPTTRDSLSSHVISRKESALTFEEILQRQAEDRKLSSVPRGSFLRAWGRLPCNNHRKRRYHWPGKKFEPVREQSFCATCTYFSRDSDGEESWPHLLLPLALLVLSLIDIAIILAGIGTWISDSTHSRPTPVSVSVGLVSVGVTLTLVVAILWAAIYICRATVRKASNTASARETLRSSKIEKNGVDNSPNDNYIGGGQAIQPSAGSAGPTSNIRVNFESPLQEAMHMTIAKPAAPSVETIIRTPTPGPRGQQVVSQNPPQSLSFHDDQNNFIINTQLLEQCASREPEPTYTTTRPPTPGCSRLPLPCDRGSERPYSSEPPRYPEPPHCSEQPPRLHSICAESIRSVSIISRLSASPKHQQTNQKQDSKLIPLKLPVVVRARTPSTSKRL